jgi:hypothetical protein
MLAHKLLIKYSTIDVLTWSLVALLTAMENARKGFLK